jgi:hypothetical protein
MARDDELIEYVTSLVEILVLPPITESSHRTTGRRLLHDKALPSQQKEGKPDISRSICSSVPEETNKIFIVSDK